MYEKSQITNQTTDRAFLTELVENIKQTRVKRPGLEPYFLHFQAKLEQSLKRRISAGEVYETLYLRLYDKPCPSDQALTKIRYWKYGKSLPWQRDARLQLALALGLDIAQANHFLQDVCLDTALYSLDIADAICMICLQFNSEHEEQITCSQYLQTVAECRKILKQHEKDQPSHSNISHQLQNYRERMQALEAKLAHLSDDGLCVKHYTSYLEKVIQKRSYPFRLELPEDLFEIIPWLHENKELYHYQNMTRQTTLLQLFAEYMWRFDEVELAGMHIPADERRLRYFRHALYFDNYKCLYHNAEEPVRLEWNHMESRSCASEISSYFRTSESISRDSMIRLLILTGLPTISVSEINRLLERLHYAPLHADRTCKSGYSKDLLIIEVLQSYYLRYSTPDKGEFIRYLRLLDQILCEQNLQPLRFLCAKSMRSIHKE